MEYGSWLLCLLFPCLAEYWNAISFQASLLSFYTFAFSFLLVPSTQGDYIRVTLSITQRNPAFVQPFASAICPIPILSLKLPIWFVSDINSFLIPFLSYFVNHIPFVAHCQTLPWNHDRWCPLLHTYLAMPRCTQRIQTHLSRQKPSRMNAAVTQKVLVISAPSLEGINSAAGLLWFWCLLWITSWGSIFQMVRKQTRRRSWRARIL